MSTGTKKIAPTTIKNLFTCSHVLKYLIEYYLPNAACSVAIAAENAATSPNVVPIEKKP